MIIFNNCRYPFSWHISYKPDSTKQSVKKKNVVLEMKQPYTNISDV